MFQYDQKTRNICDSSNGEMLRTTGHYQDPLGHFRVIDREGEEVFLCSLRHEFGEVDDSGKGVAEHIFVSGAMITKSGQPDRSDAACSPYFQRIGEYLVRTSLSKTNVRHADWHIERS